MDVLSEVLRVVSLKGALFFNGEFSAPWCLNTTSSKAFVPHLCPEARHLIIYHFITEGRAFAELRDGTREELSAGDIVVLPHGDAHYLGNGTVPKPLNSLETLAENLSQGLRLARFGGGGEITRIICGYLACEPRLSEVFLSGLPGLLKVHVAKDPSGQWLEHGLRFSVEAANGAGAGGGLIATKLSEVLFVETLRRYINGLPANRTGWLAGARDPVIGQALGLMHQDPAKPWTISELARGAGVSRTGIIERFRHYLGVSPMAYLAQWRLRLGADMLQKTEESVAEVAAAVGYGSEAAFNRAFRREFDSPPAQFRRKRKVAAEPALATR